MLVATSMYPIPCHLCDPPIATSTWLEVHTSPNYVLFFSQYVFFVLPPRSFIAKLIQSHRSMVSGPFVQSVSVLADGRSMALYMLVRFSPMQAA